MKGLFIVGLVVLILGLMSLALPIPHSQRQGLNVGGVSLGVDTQHEETVSPVLSAMILGGLVAMVAGKRKTS